MLHVTLLKPKDIAVVNQIYLERDQGQISVRPRPSYATCRERLPLIVAVGESSYARSARTSNLGYKFSVVGNPIKVLYRFLNP